jgi:alcohol dehydrogenase
MTNASVMRMPREIRFGNGTLALTGAIARQFAGSVLLCTDENIASTPGAARLMRSLADAGIECSTFARTEPDLPIACVEAAAQVAAGQHLDAVIGFGGGSCIDLAKLVSVLYVDPGPLDRFYGENMVVRQGLPVIAVPTTAGTGSEVTPVAVVSDPRRRLKVGVSSPMLVPQAAICDPEATLSCPPGVTAFAGIDALIHAVESYCAPKRELDDQAYPGDVFRGENSLTRPYALIAAHHIARSLETAISDGGDAEARSGMLFGSLCAGLAFSHAGTAIAHALQYPVGASTSTPHGLGVGLLAPYTLEFCRPDADASLAELAVRLGVADGADPAGAAIDEIARLSQASGIPRTLAEIGVEHGDLPRLAHEAASITRLLKNSPRPAGEPDLLTILEAAWKGERGDADRRAERAEK